MDHLQSSFESFFYQKYNHNKYGMANIIFLNAKLFPAKFGLKNQDTKTKMLELQGKRLQLQNTVTCAYECAYQPISLEKAAVLTDKVQQQCCVNEIYQDERGFWVATTQQFTIVRNRFKFIISGCYLKTCFNRLNHHVRDSKTTQRFERRLSPLSNVVTFIFTS